ncbi:MAG: recombinase family protein [Tepidisphaeraceae bacterium]
MAFARVSSREQERAGRSFAVQEDALRKYAVKSGGTVIRLFRIVETASKRDERTTFQEMLAYVKANVAHLDGVLVCKIDRAARNLFDYVELERLENDFGVSFVSVSKPMESNPAGRMMRRTLASMAAFYTDQQSIDVREGHERRARDARSLSLSQCPCRRPPHGSNRSKPTDNVRRIFALFAEGAYTIDSLCDKLHAEGRVFRDKRPRLPRATVRDILLDRAYLGEIEYQGQWHSGKHEPLVDRRTWNRAKSVLGVKTYKQTELTYAGGLIRCGHCGTPYHLRAGSQAGDWQAICLLPLHDLTHYCGSSATV